VDSAAGRSLFDKHGDRICRADRRAERVAAPDDVEPPVSRRLVQVRASARRGDLAAADELLREAAEIVEPTDDMLLHLALAFAQADVAHQAGGGGGERRALERALEVAEAKGNVVAAVRARGRLAEP
jgi:uncharacterized protein HemY